MLLNVPTEASEFVPVPLAIIAGYWNGVIIPARVDAKLRNRRFDRQHGVTMQLSCKPLVPSGWLDVLVIVTVSQNKVKLIYPAFCGRWWPVINLPTRR